MLLRGSGSICCESWKKGPKIGSLFTPHADYFGDLFGQGGRKRRHQQMSVFGTFLGPPKIVPKPPQKVHSGASGSQ